MASFLDYDEAIDADGSNKYPPIATKFLLRCFFSEHPPKTIGEDKCRELRTITTALDHILSGRLDQACDVLVGRLKSCQKTVKDGHNRVGKWMEVIPFPHEGLSISAEDEEMAMGIEAANMRFQQLAQKTTQR